MKITLATLASATSQQVFDQVVNHLLTQKVQSLTQSFNVAGNKAVCAYRGENNTACAAGCLISDEEMKEVMEKGLNGQGWKVLTEKLGSSSAHSELIVQLQNIHDYGNQNWGKNLRHYATNKKLDFNWVEAPEPVTT